MRSYAFYSLNMLTMTFQIVGPVRQGFLPERKTIHARHFRTLIFRRQWGFQTRNKFSLLLKYLFPIRPYQNQWQGKSVRRMVVCIWNGEIRL